MFLIITNSGISFGQEKNVSTANQQWIQYYNQVQLDEKWVWLTDGGFRWKNGFDKNSQYIIRTAIGYNLHPSIRVSTGFAHLGYFLSNKVVSHEYRPYQELQFKQAFNKISLTHRYRVEERYFHLKLVNDKQSANSFNFRFRYSVMLNIPLWQLAKDQPDKLVLLSLGDEIFLNAGKQIVNNIFDQNRLIISPTVQFNKNLSMALTWNTIFAKGIGEGNYRKVNVAWLQIKHKLDFRKFVNQ